MPLSEEELRLLDQMERALAAEDPKFVSTIRGTSAQRSARRRSYAAVAVLVVGMGVMLLGAASGTSIVSIVIGVVGFGLMLAAAYVGVTSWRSQFEQPQQPEEDAPGAEEAFGLNLIRGGKAGKAGKPGKAPRGRPSKGPRPSGSAGGSSGSFMQRMEQRWQRRRDNGGF